MNLKEKFELCKAYGVTNALLARHIGKGEGTVSGILNDKYDSANAQLYKASIEAFLDKIIAKNTPTKGAQIPKSEVWLSLVLKSRTQTK
ncbi:hypothetical protein [Campylobacter sp. 7477a]|uniref:hypothetical protein n=1 Tax=Campylobacter sp. 7477a TaxID=2735741 RepID=UPI0030142F56|nr:hypothetical protein [Campylobacter sp. 7477a]